MKTRLPRLLSLLVLGASLALGPAVARAEYFGGILLVPNKAAFSVEENVSNSELLTPPYLNLVNRGGYYGLRLGFIIQPKLAVEAHYGEKDKLPALNGVTSFSGLADSPARTRRYGLDIVSAFPLTGKLTVTGRAGIIVARTDGLFGNGNDVTTLGGTAGRMGVGLQYDVTRSLGLHLEVDRFHRLGGAAIGGETTGENYSVGMRYKF